MPIKSMATVQHEIKKSLWKDTYTDAQLNILARLHDDELNEEIVKLIGSPDMTEEQTLTLGKIAHADKFIPLKVVQYIAKPEYTPGKMQELYDRTKLLQECKKNGLSDEVIRVLGNPALNKGQVAAMVEIAREDPEVPQELWDYLSTPRFDGRIITLLYQMSKILSIAQLKLVTDRTNDDDEIQAYMEAYQSGVVPSDMKKMINRGLTETDYPLSDEDRKNKRGLNKDQIPEVVAGFQERLPEEIIKAYTPVGEDAVKNGTFDREQMQEIRRFAKERLASHLFWTADLEDETVQFYAWNNGTISEDVADLLDGINVNVETLPKSGVIVIHPDNAAELMTLERFMQIVNKSTDDSSKKLSTHTPVEQCLIDLQPILDVNLGPNQMKFIESYIKKGASAERLDQLKIKWFSKFDDEQMGVLQYALDARLPEDIMNELLYEDGLSASYMKAIVDNYINTRT